MPLRRALALAAAAGALAVLLAARADEPPAAAKIPDAAALGGSQSLLALAIEQMQAGRAGDALRNLENLTRQQPDFRLGRQIYGDLLATVKSESQSDAVPDAELKALAEEAQMRLASEKAVPPPGMMPDSIIQLAPNFRTAILVDLPRARLYVLERRDGTLTLTRHHYIGIGKNGYGKQVEGDQRTPIGIYTVTGWKTDAELPELYGSGAMPLNYPNRWDQMQRRSGTGIWLHGVPRNLYTRPPRSSEGCVTMANEDLLELGKFVTAGITPVVLSDRMQWLEPAQMDALRSEWNARIEGWRKSWSDRDSEAYLAHYSPEFSTGKSGFAAFAEYKRRVNASKKFIAVDLRDINIYRYPGTAQPAVMVEFTQDYRSDNYASIARKRQFWSQDAAGTWKILREDPV